MLTRAGLHRDLVIRAQRANPARRGTARPAASRTTPPTASGSGRGTIAGRAAAAAATARTARSPQHQAATAHARHTAQQRATIEAEVRRRPVGRTVAAICRDLDISPTLCEGGLQTACSTRSRWYGGSLGSVVLEMRQRRRPSNRSRTDIPPWD